MRRILGLIGVLLLVGHPALAQDGPPMPRDDEQFNNLVSLRITNVLMQMDLSVTSEKGAALMELMKQEAEDTRAFHQRRDELANRVLSALEGSEENLVEVIHQIETATVLHFQQRIQFVEDLQNLLTAEERARYYLAESRFKKRVQRLINERRRGPGGMSRRR